MVWNMARHASLLFQYLAFSPDLTVYKSSSTLISGSPFTGRIRRKDSLTSDDAPGMRDGI